MTTDHVLIVARRPETFVGPEPGCYGCLGTGLTLWGHHARTLCSCITCPDHDPDAFCECLDRDAIEMVLLARLRPQREDPTCPSTTAG